MRKILVANTKGGSGKTTLVTNLAGYFANQGHIVAINDIDKQQSSTQWLLRRPKAATKIHLFEDGKDKQKADWLITDSPGGLRDKKISDAVKEADLVLVPIQPSAFDIGAATDFLEMLAEEKSIRKEKTFVGLVGMRINPRTKSTAKLYEFMMKTGFPILSAIRNTQLYVTAAEDGLSIFDMRPSLLKADTPQWQPILEWIDENNS